MEESFGWPYFSSTMSRFAEDGERRFAPMLEVIELLDALVGKIVGRETSYASERPQDYVASILVTRTFRLTIASIRLALSGYSDACPNLYRTVWEISIRLLDMSREPVEAAIGFLLQNVHEELGAARAEWESNPGGEPATRENSNVSALEARQAKFEKAARLRALDPHQVRKRHGNLNYRSICESFEIEKAYLVNYAFSSGYVHEKNWATREFLSDGDDGTRQFNLAPTAGARSLAIHDALSVALQVMAITGGIVQDAEVTAQADLLLDGLEQRLGPYRDLGELPPDKCVQPDKAPGR